MTVLDIVQGQVQLVRVGVGAAVFAAVAGQNRPDLDLPLLVDEQHVVVQHRHGRLGPLGDVQEAEGVAGVGVHHGVFLDLAHVLQPAHVEEVLAEQLSRPGALDTPLSELRVLLLQECYLLPGELGGLACVLLLQLEPPVVAGPHPMLVEDLLHGGPADVRALQLQEHAWPVAPPPGGVLQ